MGSTSEALVLGVDIGTFEAKGVVVDAEGTIVASAVRSHELRVPRAGFAEHDAETVWWQGFVEIVRELLGSDDVEPHRIAAVCCSGIGPCVLPVKRDGQPLGPAILYGVDTRAQDQIDQMNARLGEAQIISRAGNALSSQSAGPKIAWLRENDPDAYHRADLFVTCQSFVVGRLTGRWVIDHGTAGYFHPLYDLDAQRWNTSGLEDIVDAGRLPELVWADEIVGAVSAEMAVLTGIPSGTPVLAGSADAPAEALSAGIRSAGDMMIMYGSSHFLLQVVDRPVRGTSLYTAPYLFPGTHVLAAGTSTAGTITRWFAELVGREPGPDASAFADLAAEAAASPPGARGLLALPHFSGERTPHNDASLRGGIVGLTLTHTRGDVYRAILEGIAHSVGEVLDAYRDAGHAPTRISAVGGGTRNEVWLQGVSDVTGYEQHVMAGPGASLGDAMLAALAAGIIPDRSALAQWVRPVRVSTPRPEHRSLYERNGQLLAAFRAATESIVRRVGQLPEEAARE